MRKTLIIAGILALTMSQVVIADEVETTVPEIQKATIQKQAEPSDKPKTESQFEKRLKLTDEQKQQAKEIRMIGHNEIKPVIEQINLKSEEIDAVKRSTLSVQEQAAKILELKNEIQELERKAHEIRMSNMKKFESILTQKQMKELKKMKEEGRKKFEKEHKKGLFPPHDKGFGVQSGNRPPIPPSGI